MAAEEQTHWLKVGSNNENDRHDARSPPIPTPALTTKKGPQPTATQQTNKTRSHRHRRKFCDDETPQDRVRQCDMAHTAASAQGVRAARAAAGACVLRTAAPPPWLLQRCALGCPHGSGSAARLGALAANVAWLPTVETVAASAATPAAAGIAAAAAARARLGAVAAHVS